MGVFHVEQEDERDGATDKAEWVSESIGEGVVLAIRTGACEVAIQSSVQRIEIHRGASALGGLYRLDGVAMAAVGDEFILHENLVFPAAVAHGAPKRVLVLGGGDGGSVRRLLRIPAVGEIHVVEIDEAVVRAAESHLAPIHRGAFSDPRVHLHIADAAQVFAGADRGAARKTPYERARRLPSGRRASRGRRRCRIRPGSRDSRADGPACR